jgi:hypothetical protein
MLVNPRPIDLAKIVLVGQNLKTTRLMTALDMIDEFKLDLQWLEQLPDSVIEAAYNARNCYWSHRNPIFRMFYKTNITANARALDMAREMIATKIQEQSKYARDAYKTVINATFEWCYSDLQSILVAYCGIHN